MSYTWTHARYLLLFELQKFGLNLVCVYSACLMIWKWLNEQIEPFRRQCCYLLFTIFCERETLPQAKLSSLMKMNPNTFRYIFKSCSIHAVRPRLMIRKLHIIWKVWSWLANQSWLWVMGLLLSCSEEINELP